MRGMKRGIRSGALAGTFVAACIMTLAAHGKNGSAPGLLRELPAYNVKTPPAAAIGNAKAVGINRASLRGGLLTLALPGGDSFEAVRLQHRDHGNGRETWVGHARGRSEERVIIGMSGDAVSGTFTHRGKMFKLEPRSDGSHVVSQVSRRLPAPELDPIPEADKPNRGGGGSGGDSTATPESPETTGPVVIDIMVAYTPAVAAIYGTQGAEALIVQAIAETNQAYLNSGIEHRLNLVGAVATDYMESGDMQTDLSRLRSTSDSFMDELHTMRDGLGADLVSLIQHEPAYCGLAYRMTSNSAGFASSAFSIVHHGCATGYYSFAHELGHNQGAHHNIENANGSMYDYGYGYRDESNGFRTIMAYNCVGGCIRIDHFSRSDVYFNGAATGLANNTENAFVIDQTAATVAAFRAATEPLQTTTVPAVPSDLQLTAMGTDSMELNWARTSDDESGFVIERFDAVVEAFVEVVSLPAGTESWRDQGLSANSYYGYRIKAWNSQGSSAFSDPVVAATQAEDGQVPLPGC